MRVCIVINEQVDKSEQHSTASFRYAGREKAAYWEEWQKKALLKEWTLEPESADCPG